jgi:hypothetical protein
MIGKALNAIATAATIITCASFIYLASGIRVFSRLCSGTVTGGDIAMFLFLSLIYWPVFFAGSALSFNLFKRR